MDLYLKSLIFVSQMKCFMQAEETDQLLFEEMVRIIFMLVSN